MDAIILAGGKGQRMSQEVPKPLMKVRGKAIIERQIEYLLPHTEKIIISLGHRAEEIEVFVRQRFPNQNIAFAIETQPLGTGGGLRLAMQHSHAEKVAVLNCDDIADIPLEELQAKNEHIICVAHPRLPFGLVKEKNGFAAFEEKPLLKEWVSCGWYMFMRETLMPLLPEKGSLEYDVFPRIQLRLHTHEGFWKPLNTPKDIEEFETMESD
ncbi:MAG: NTP transferase domain-containing protein [Candidatus Iainarchaeum archaeon]|uniref:NTP transferase domain-containing protein n=1 Tax=Candidatus Iainarchaeum sp. TaxID=3101447 RepID=A0A7T9DJR6_9ARCH|nr:MAG: NTP transferase domain-containing protein [Candidatus Diapherotrites archaeon]